MEDNLPPLTVRALEEKITTRFEAMDEANRLIREEYTRVPTVVDRAILGLRELLEMMISKLQGEVNERFRGIDAQFVERDKRADQLALTSTTAVNAALAAAKESGADQNRYSAAAIAKSEANTAKQIDQLQLQFKTSMDALNAKIDDVKFQQAQGAGHSKGVSDGWGWIVAAVSIIGTILAFAIRH